MMKFENLKFDSWINRSNCELIKISNKMTYISHLDISQFVLDLIFTTLNFAENIVDWAINDEIMTKSDHEVTAFNLLSKKEKSG